jgi:hypothetical protein
VVIGVTSLLVAVTNDPFKVSFDVTFCTVTGVVADAIVVGPSFTALLIYYCSSSIITICWVTFNPVDWFHNW